MSVFGPTTTVKISTEVQTSTVITVSSPKGTWRFKNTDGRWGVQVGSAWQDYANALVIALLELSLNGNGDIKNG